MNPITLFLTIVSVLLGVGAGLAGYTSLAFAFFVLAVLIAASLKMANAWQKFVILRAGKLQSVKGPGLFVIVPIVAVLLVWAAASTNSHGGVLYWMSRISQIAFLGWCAWACSATPAATRIALWSLPGWGALILTLFTYGPVAIVFALATLTILFVNVFIAVLPERGSRNAV